MKRKLLAMVCAVSMIASLGAATVYASDDVKATGDEKIALITMDSIDQHWITLNEGAQEEAKELGVTPMATWIGGELAGCDPAIMGIGPVYSTRKVMKKLGMEIGDFDLIEANEAFAAQSVAVGKDLGFDLSKLNVNGGAIALGHPVGCSGARILVSLLYEMQKEDVHTGLATLCVGGGMGCSAVVKRDQGQKKRVDTFLVSALFLNNLGCVDKLGKR